jgi:uncharacterized repeat protein (TIGR01451 family)
MNATNLVHNKTRGAATMKSPFVVIFLLCTVLTCAFAQQAQEGVAADFKGVSITFHGNPQAADAKLLPLIDGKAGSKERFGISFGGVTPSGKAVEILDKDGTVLKSISIGELLAGKGEGFALVAQPAGPSQARWLEKSYLVDLPQGKVQFSMKALVTGDTPSDRHLVVTLSLKSDVTMALAIRASLPVNGLAETNGKGFLLSSKAGTATIAVAIYPGSSALASSKSQVTITSPTVSLESGKESGALWLVMDGVTGNSASSTKQQAIKILKEKRFGESDPRIVVVSNADRPTTQPGEIVTYSVVCKNIGTADATDVTLSNPVSDGMQYLEGSATSNGSTVSFEPGGAASAVKKINWRFHDPIRPGEERQVSFKVRVL